MVVYDGGVAIPPSYLLTIHCIVFMRDVYIFVCIQLIVALLWRISVACSILWYRLVEGLSKPYPIEARLYHPPVPHHLEPCVWYWA